MSPAAYAPLARLVRQSLERHLPAEWRAAVRETVARANELVAWARGRWSGFEGEAEALGRVVVGDVSRSRELAEAISHGLGAAQVAAACLALASELGLELPAPLALPAAADDPRVERLPAALRAEWDATPPDERAAWLASAEELGLITS